MAPGAGSLGGPGPAPPAAGLIFSCTAYPDYPAARPERPDEMNILNAADVIALINVNSGENRPPVNAGDIMPPGKCQVDALIGITDVDIHDRQARRAVTAQVLVRGWLAYILDGPWIRSRRGSIAVLFRIIDGNAANGAVQAAAVNAYRSPPPAEPAAL